MYPMIICCGVELTKKLVDLETIEIQTEFKDAVFQLQNEADRRGGEIYAYRIRFEAVAYRKNAASEIADKAVKAAEELRAPWATHD